MLVPFADLVDEVIELVREDAAALESEDEVKWIRTIFDRGNSATRQRRAYAGAIKNGADEQEALREVTRMLADDFLADCKLQSD